MFLELLQKLGRALEGGAIPYMIIGGQAVLVYGEARLTKDIDITLGVFLDRLAEVLSLVTTLGLRVLVDPEEFTRRTLVLPCQDPLTGIRVDFIFSWSEYEQQALKRRRGLFLGEQIVYFASLEDVLIHKVIAGRPRDLEDVRRLLQKNPQVDEAYLSRWLRWFDEALGASYSAMLAKLSASSS